MEETCDKGPCVEWTSWSEWSTCSQSCGGGEQTRERMCKGGSSCEGQSKVIFSNLTYSCQQCCYDRPDKEKPGCQVFAK